MQGVSAIPVFRPTKLTDGPEFQGSLVESSANIFYQQVHASRATLDRIQFQWRSVSDNLLVSPVCRLRFKLKIKCRKLWTQISSIIAVQGLKGTSHNAQTNPLALTALQANANHAQVPLLVFADGDAFTNCCTSINLQFNGTSLSLNRTNMFWRDYMRTQLSSDDAAKIYKCAGGRYDQFDSRAVAVGSEAGDNANAVNERAFIRAGLTQDSGVSDRSKALYASLVDHQIGNNAADFSRDVWVSYPIPVAPFNPWNGVVLPNSCPYKNCPLAIPHLSAGGLDFLMSDFKTSFIRRLGGSLAYGGAGTGLTARGAEAVQIEMGAASDCILELKYFRLSHTRTLKESYRFNVWQTQTFLGPVPPSDATLGHVAQQISGVAKNGVAPTGKDFVTATAGQLSLSTISADDNGRIYEVQFDALNLAQVPSFLLISAPRMTDCYTMGDDVDGEVPNCMRNLSRNLSIKSLKIVVNSARGAIDIDGSDRTGFVNAERLFEMTQENAGGHYFKSGGFRAWRDYGCAVLLNSTQFAPGLQVCDGIAYPIQIQINMTLQNRCVDVCPERLHGATTTTPGGQAGPKNVPSVIADCLRSQAQATAFYTKIILATSETSATTNAMNYPLSSAERMLNAAGQMR
jgi:hypothetical protein